ncbi:stimulator of interferon genes protein-like [Pollicipes pollicipes]|uniref:stimulator of interferon genes protein-like n=1 Tax=Pollicipes pollicipes TaxID=41117 RepID=UPI001884D22D|nr:stimulator of interferon genes protein-like [Pollicipes pollicipes]
MIGLEPWCGGALLVIVFAVYAVFLGAWEATSLLCLCTLCVLAARWLQRAFLRRQLQRKQPRRLAAPNGCDDREARTTLGVACLAAAVVLLLVVIEPTTLDSALARWYLALVAPLLAFVFQAGGTPQTEMAEALRKTQTSYSEGAAWLFYLGYLQIILGGENGKRFETRMDDYMLSQQIVGDSRRRTCRKAVFILVPMTPAAMLSDLDYRENDSTVSKEKKLLGITVKGRPYGETQVYQVEYDGRVYRVAMEVASPTCTALRTVDDSKVDFGASDYEEFAARFLGALQDILEQKPTVGAQVELMPIYDSRKFGRAVVEHFLKMNEAEVAPADCSAGRRPPVGRGLRPLARAEFGARVWCRQQPGNGWPLGAALTLGREGALC